MKKLNLKESTIRSVDESEATSVQGGFFAPAIQGRMDWSEHNEYGGDINKYSHRGSRKRIRIDMSTRKVKQVDKSKVTKIGSLDLTGGGDRRRK